MKNHRERVYEGQSEIVRAKKEHKCDCCGITIRKDDWYIKVVQLRPKFQTFKSCKYCHRTAIRIWGD